MTTEYKNYRVTRAPGYYRLGKIYKPGTIIALPADEKPSTTFKPVSSKVKVDFSLAPIPVTVPASEDFSEMDDEAPEVGDDTGAGDVKYLQTRAEFVAAGNKAKDYDAFIKAERAAAKEAGFKVKIGNPPAIVE